MASDSRQRGRGLTSASSAPARAPRAARSSRQRADGRLPDLLARSTATAPSPRAGQFYMLAAAERLGRRGRAARTCPAPSRSPRPRSRTRGVRLDFLSRRRPGHRAARRASAGGATVAHRAARPSVLAAERARLRGRRGDPRRRRDRARAAGDPAPPAGGPRRRRARTLLGFRDQRALGRASTSSSAAARCGWRARTATRATRATSPSCSRCCWRATTRAIGGRLRVRAAGDARGGPRDVRSSAGVARRAGDGGADGLRLRRLLRLRGPARRRRLHAPLRGRAGGQRRGDRDGAGRGDPGIDRAGSGGRARRASPRASGAQRLAGPSTRSPPGGPSATPCSTSSRSRPSSRRRSRPSRGRATRRRGSSRRPRG